MSPRPRRRAGAFATMAAGWLTIMGYPLVCSAAAAGVAAGWRRRQAAYSRFSHQHGGAVSLNNVISMFLDCWLLDLVALWGHL